MTRRIFEHAFYNFEQLTATTIDGKRYYPLPDGTLAQSVTTRIGQVMDKTFLNEWRARIGEAEAQKITTQAANRGTAFHNICESYLMNEPNYPKGTMPSNIDSFKQIRPILDKHIGKIFGIEAPLYSYNLKAAGRTDCIAEWDGVPTIVDFKTSKKTKKKEWIESYLLQATCYALMTKELIDLDIQQFAIIVSVDNDEPQLFVDSIASYVDKVREIFI